MTALEFPSLSEAVRRTAEAYKTRFVPLLLLNLLGVAAAIAFVLAGIAALVVAGMISKPLILLPLVALLPAAAFLMSAAGVAGVLLVVDPEREPGELFKKSMASAFPFMGLWLLETFILVGASGWLLVPGLVLVVYFAFAQVLFVTEDLRGLDALAASGERMRGRWWSAGVHLSLPWTALLLSMFIPFVGPILRFLFGQVGTVYTWVLLDSLTPKAPADEPFAEVPPSPFPPPSDRIKMFLLLLALTGWIVGGILGWGTWVWGKPHLKTLIRSPQVQQIWRDFKDQKQKEREERKTQAADWIKDAVGLPAKPTAAAGASYEAFAADPDPRVRRDLVPLLANAGRRDLLEALAQDEDPRVRKAAEAALAKSDR